MRGAARHICVALAISASLLALAVAPQAASPPRPSPAARASSVPLRVPAVSFPAAQISRLANGVIIVSQTSADSPLIGAQIFIPAGLLQQSSDAAGIAGITAAMVLQTPVEGNATLADTVAAAGGSISYTLAPADTHYYLECRDADFPRLLHDLRSALRHPAVAQLPAARTKALSAIDQLTKNPLESVYAMIRQVRYQGTGFAYPDSGNVLAVRRLSVADVLSYAASSQRGGGTIVALEGAVSPAVLASARTEFSDFAAGAAAAVPNPRTVERTSQVVEHRDVPVPWVAVAYEAPSQYSADFATMLVIEALLGQGGDVNALAFNSDAAAPAQYVGAYYQYEARPGSLIVFLDGDTGNVDQAIRDLQGGIARLRTAGLSSDLIAQAKRLALGNFYVSINDLSEQSWLLGRAAASPDGAQFENLLPQRIAAVSAADIHRVSQRYLSKETVALVLPQTAAP